MAEWIFMDLEWNTTYYRSREGERLPFHELLEVAAIKVNPLTGAMLDSYHNYIRPTVGKKLASRTYRILPYEREELSALLSDAPGFVDMGPEFLHWCGEAPIFVEWGNNDVEVLLSNFAFHRLSLDPGWKCEYYDLQYVYQRLKGESLGCQPSLESVVEELGLSTGLDFHSAWNDTYYTVLVYQALLDKHESLTLFRRPPKRKGPPPLWEMELGVTQGRWSCKNLPEIQTPHCPLCGEALTKPRWLRTAPGEQVSRLRCRNHRRLYMAITTQRAPEGWEGKAALYKDAGPVAERYRKALRKMADKP